jgi:pSer/pThr/pTyr-binding forkhead associated (FHA) protein
MNLYVLNGPEIGRSVELKEGVWSLGRAKDTDIRIQDATVSRTHLKIVIEKDRYFITDLKSQNKTYYGGKYLIPGEEEEIVEGAPVAIGMTVICLGEKCRDKMAPYLDTATLIRRKGERGGLEDRRKRTWQKRGDLINKVFLAVKEDLPLIQMLGDVLGHIFHHLKRVDRGAFILTDPGGGDAKRVICRVSNSAEESKAAYSDRSSRP